jgi:hypothetical protein
LSASLAAVKAGIASSKALEAMASSLAITIACLSSSSFFLAAYSC